MMIYKQMTHYLRGQLTEDQAMKLWSHLLLRPRLLEMLIIELQLKQYFTKKQR